MPVSPLAGSNGTPWALVADQSDLLLPLTLTCNSVLALVKVTGCPGAGRAQGESYENHVCAGTSAPQGRRLVSLPCSMWYWASEHSGTGTVPAMVLLVWEGERILASITDEEEEGAWSCVCETWVNIQAEA